MEVKVGYWPIRKPKKENIRKSGKENLIKYEWKESKPRRIGGLTG